MASSKRKVITLTAAASIVLLFLCQSWVLNFHRPNSVLLPPTTNRLNPNDPIPKKIWYKLGPKGLGDEARGWTDTCIQRNPAYEAVFLTDATADAWIAATYAHRPDIVATYLALPIPMVKADWLRYLLLYAEGGMWSDLDASCHETPIDEWIPAQYRSASAHASAPALVVGWEFDAGWGANVVHQLAAWTVLAKPGLPYMRAAIEDVLHAVRDVAARNRVAVANVTVPMLGDIVDFSGPRRMTRSVFGALQRTLGATDAAFREVEASTWFAVEPRLVHDVLVLPGWAFARSMNTYNDSVSVGPSLVTHHYAGSWKNDKGGE